MCGWVQVGDLFKGMATWNSLPCTWILSFDRNQGFSLNKTLQNSKKLEYKFKLEKKSRYEDISKTLKSP